MAITAIVVVWGGYFMFGSSSDNQSENTKPQGPAIVAVNFPEALSDKAQFGETAFNAKCAEFHGPNAEGQKGIAPPLIHKIYEPSHHGDVAFLRAAENGVRSHHLPFGDMPPWHR